MIGRFLIVVTFLEDAIRIMTQWRDQLTYLHDYRHCGYQFADLTLLTHSVPTGLNHIFLTMNVLAMLACSTLVIARKYSNQAVAGLLVVVITQALGYGLIFDLNFFLRNLSVMGGLLMVLSDSWVRKTFAPAGLPQVDEADRKMYVQLAGRVLLIFLFVGFVFAGDWGVGRVVVSVLGFVACVMVVVGFKTKFSSVMLVVILSIFNLLVNNFWTVSKSRMTDGSLIGISCMSITRKRILQSTTFSKFCRLCKLVQVLIFEALSSSLEFSTLSSSDFLSSSLG